MFLQPLKVAILDDYFDTLRTLPCVYIGVGGLRNEPSRDGVHAFLGGGRHDRRRSCGLPPFSGRRERLGGPLLAAELSAVGGTLAVSPLQRVRRGPAPQA